MTVGQRIRQLREAQGLSLRGLAGKSGVSAGHTSLIELGKNNPSVSTVERIAGALGLKAYELLAPDDYQAQELIELRKAARQEREQAVHFAWEVLESALGTLYAHGAISHTANGVIQEIIKEES